MDRLDHCLEALGGQLDEFTSVERVKGGLELRDATGEPAHVVVEREDDWLIFSLELAPPARIAHLSVYDLGQLTLLWNADRDLVTRAIGVDGGLVARCANREATLDPNELAAMLAALVGQQPVAEKLEEER
jgi:hypothetical protein